MADSLGDILYVRTTDEPVVYFASIGPLRLVRRPIMGQDGIRYRIGLFHGSELETLQEQTQRTLAIIKARNDISMAEMQDFGPDMPMPHLHFKKNTN